MLHIAYKSAGKHSICVKLYTAFTVRLFAACEMLAKLWLR